MKTWCCVVLGLMLASCAGTDGVRAPVAESSPSDWSEFAFPGKRKTRYAVEWLDGKSVIRADADRSASMWRRSVRLTPADMGQVSFSWWVPQLMATADLSDGDVADSPVRVVLAFEGDRAKLSSRDRMMFDLAHTLTGEAPPYATLMYVWDTKADPGTVIPGNRSGRIRKIVVDSGPTHVKSWRKHTRSIAADFRQAFGEEPGALVGVAVMTDSDNTQSKVRAYYGDIVLTRADGQPL